MTGILNKAINIVIKSNKTKDEKECLNIFEMVFAIFKVLPLMILFLINRPWWH
jgi:hypothetical protein